MNKKIILLLFFFAVVIALRYSPLGQFVTFENLKRHREDLLVLVRSHYLIAVLLFITVYIIGTGLSMPGAAIFTLSGGFMFGAATAVFYVNVGATTGATLAFLVARYLLGNRLQEKYKIQMSAFNREMRENGKRYLLTLRLIPVIPFFLINFLSGLTNVPVKTFIWTTSLGIIPSSIVFAYAGQQIGSINSPSEIFSAPVIIAFAVLALLAISPAVMKRIKMIRRRSL